MQRVLNEIEPGAAVQVENIPGAAGTIGLARFVQSERGNPNALLVTGLVMVSGAITNRSPISLADATPIARLTGETEVIVVPPGSPYRTIGELVAAFTKNPGSIAWGGGSAGGTDDLLVRLMAEQLGVPPSRVNYIAFAGGGAALAAVLGGQVTAAVSGYGEFAGQIAAGQLRPLAISAASRVDGIDAPTLRESSIALDLSNWRAVIGPPGLSEAERARLTERVMRMTRSAQWQKTLILNGWEDLSLSDASFRQFLIAEQSRIESVLRRLAAGDAASPTAASSMITPTTVPVAIVSVLGLFAAAGLMAAFRQRRSTVERHARDGFKSTIWLAMALAVQPLLLFNAGFVLSATALFAITAAAIRGQFSARLALRDGAIGLAFSITVYLIFSRGLGIVLPSLPDV